MAFIVDPNTHIEGICQMPQDKLKEFASDTMNDKDYKENDFTEMCRSIVKFQNLTSKQRIALAKMIVYSGVYDEDELEEHWNQ